MYQHVLAAVDLSENTARLLRAAAEMRQLGAKVSVVYVCNKRVTGYGEVTSGNHIANDLQEKQAAFPDLKRAVEAAGFNEADMHLLAGNPADEIHKFAEQQACDLILVGSHGTGGVRALLGSIAHDVLRDAKCDVLTIRIYE